MTAPLADLGRALARCGLTARALAAWCGTSTLARLPERLPTAEPRGTVADTLALFVAGAALAPARARACLGASLAPCLAHGLLDERGGALVAPRAILPVGRSSFVVCDPLDEPHPRAPTPWPDDSSHHLCGALANVRAARWLDLGTGSAVAPLVVPQLAPLIVGAELVPRTAAAAALGAALSGQRNLHLVVSDLDDSLTGTWDVVSCNAPIPDPAGVTALPAASSCWHRTDSAFLPRLGQAIQRLLAPGGLAVLHTALAPLLPVLAELGGDALSVVYTPAEHPTFAVTWWQPHLPTRQRAVRRLLTRDRPHLDGADRDDADNSRLPALPDPGGS